MVNRFTILFLFITTVTFGQASGKDSLLIKNEALRREILSTRKLLNTCTVYEYETPVWANKKLKPKTYYRGCQWSGTYFVFNNDSTFLYVSWVEPQQYFLQKGIWQMLNDSTFKLTGDYNLSLQFQNKMKKLEQKEYKVEESLATELIIEADVKKLRR